MAGEKDRGIGGKRPFMRGTFIVPTILVLSASTLIVQLLSVGNRSVGVPSLDRLASAKLPPAGSASSFQAHALGNVASASRENHSDPLEPAPSVPLANPEVVLHHVQCPHGIARASEHQERLATSECAVPPPVSAWGTVVFVHIGDDLAFGKHMLFSVAQVRRTNPSVSIAAVMSRTASEDPQVRAHMECHGVELTLMEDLEKSGIISAELDLFRKDFFVSGDMGIRGNPKDFNAKTSERLIYLLGYMKHSGRQHIFHLENDNLIFVDLAKMKQDILACGMQMAVGMVDRTKAVLGFHFIDATSSLQALVDFMNQQFQAGKPAMQKEFQKHLGLAKHEWINDMYLAALYRAKNPEKLSYLPSSVVDSDSPAQCFFNRTKYIMDSGGLGMWFLGDFHDARPLSNKHGYGTYNTFDPRPWNMSRCMKGRCTTPFLNKDDGSVLAVGHLHVHSKRVAFQVSSCLVGRLGLRELHSPRTINNIAWELELQTKMYGDLNLMERLGTPARHPEGSSWKVLGQDRRPSYPFVSGDGFRGMCAWHCGEYGDTRRKKKHLTHSLTPQCNIREQYVQNGDCVFIELTDSTTGLETGAYLHHFLDVILPTLTRKVVIVTHNSNLHEPAREGMWSATQNGTWPEHPAETYLTDPKVLHWFASNCLFQSDKTQPKPSKLTCLPLGIQNRYTSSGKDPSVYVKQMYKLSNTSAAPDLIMMERGHLNTAHEKGILGIVKITLSFVTEVVATEWSHWADSVMKVPACCFFSLIAVCFGLLLILGWFTIARWPPLQHKFVLCTSSALDRQRVWEVLLMGRFPVTLRSSLDSVYAGLPVLILSEWGDLSVQLLGSAHHHFSSSSDLHLEKLFAHYWKSLISSRQQGAWE